MEIEQLISELQERNRKLGKWINEDQICFYREELNQLTSDTAHAVALAVIGEVKEMLEEETNYWPSYQVPHFCEKVWGEDKHGNRYEGQPFNVTDHLTNLEAKIKSK